jgi:cyanophycin synthetase
MLFNIIIIIILLLCILNKQQQEGIQFYAGYMKPYYKKHKITYLPKEKLLKKGDKYVSIKNGFNTVESRKLSNNKYKTKRVLIANNIPTPNYYYWNNNISFTHNIELLKQNLKFPIVIKPNSSSQGANIYANVSNIFEATKIMKKMLLKTNDIIIEEQVNGISYRIFVFNDVIIASYKILYPYVIGDGVNTVKQLINKLNQKSEKILDSDQIDVKYIKTQGYGLSSILPKNKKIIITKVSNGSIGSVPIYIDESEIHPDNIKMFKKINKLMNLNVNGIDYITTSLSVPYYVYGKVLETNSIPGMNSIAKIRPKSLDKFVELINFDV